MGGNVRIQCISLFTCSHWGFPGGTSDKEPACQHRTRKGCRLDPWVRKIPWRRKWQPTPAFLPGESHGQRSLGATVHGVSRSRTRLKRLSTQSLRNGHTWAARPHWGVCDIPSCPSELEGLYRGSAVRLPAFTSNSPSSWRVLILSLG